MAIERMAMHPAPSVWPYNKSGPRTMTSFERGSRLTGRGLSPIYERHLGNNNRKGGFYLIRYRSLKNPRPLTAIYMLINSLRFILLEKWDGEAF